MLRTLKDDSTSDDDGDDDLPLSHAVGSRRPSIHHYPQFAPMMLNDGSHRRYTMNDLNSQLRSAKLVQGAAQSGWNSHQWMARFPREQQLYIQDWKKYDQGSVLAESMIVPVSPPLSSLPSPTALDMEKLDKRHRSSLTRLQSSVTLAFEGAKLKKQLEERQRVEAKEMAARELRRQTLPPTTSESVPKDEKPRKRVVRAPPPKHRKPRRPLLAFLFLCFKSKPIERKEAPHDVHRTASLDTPGLSTFSSMDEKEPLPSFDSPRSSLRPHLASTHSRTDSLEKVVVDWRASRRTSSTPAAVVSGLRTPFAPRHNATNYANVPETDKSTLTTKKPSKHSWLDY
ncbi:BQ2448_2178 [Microbotryum intermedium]|uniref:BQ2448_2178 protein n=1 Tax=Microbotryum intermedium TaxID=269621 RepID=A0A238FDD7_9BASI|nr:BQ2448_2178 [Microbotryum intermedium]